MKNLIILFSVLLLSSCGREFKTYYKIESVKVQPIRKNNIERLHELSGLPIKFLEMNKGGFMVFDGKNWAFKTKQDFNKLYSKKIKGLWTKEKSSFYYQLEQYRY
jgi:hypothetical protein